MDLPLSRAQDDSKNARDSPAEPSALSAAPSTSSAGSQPATSPKIAPSSSGSNKAAHRQSFAENMRSVPPSPRHRHPSLTHAAVQELVNYPPPGNRQASYNFANRDWRDITLGELVSPEDVDWVELDSSVEEASKVGTASFASTLHRFHVVLTGCLQPCFPFFLTLIDSSQEQGQCRPDSGICRLKKCNLNIRLQ